MGEQTIMMSTLRILQTVLTLLQVTITPFDAWNHFLVFSDLSQGLLFKIEEEVKTAIMVWLTSQAFHNYKKWWHVTTNVSKDMESMTKVEKDELNIIKKWKKNQKWPFVENALLSTYF